MENELEISFSIKDTLLNEELAPDNLNLPALNEFSNQVIRFLRGTKGHDLTQVKASIEPGSLRLRVRDEERVLQDVFSDYTQGVVSGNLDEIDPVRASVIELWQQQAKASISRSYELSTGPSNNVGMVVRISAETNFHKQKSLIVEVEEYVYGQIFDMGGKSKPNVHIELDNGKTLTVGSETSQLTEDRTNRLYSKQLIRITAKKNLKTNELQDEKLIAFENYSPHFDEDEFQAIVRKGRIAWRSISDPNAWLEELRGNA